MKKHTYNFVEEYDGPATFGWNRESDEETIKFYLQKFADDTLLNLILPRLADSEMEEIYDLINKLLKRHLSESQYHRVFLKDGTH